MIATQESLDILKRIQEIRPDLATETLDIDATPAGYEKMDEAGQAQWDRIVDGFMLDNLNALLFQITHGKEGRRARP